MKVVVNDQMQMQKGYVYYGRNRLGRNFAPGFTPELTPKQMFALGVFGGEYMTDCRDEFRRAGSPARGSAPSGHDVVRYRTSEA